MPFVKKLRFSKEIEQMHLWGEKPRASDYRDGSRKIFPMILINRWKTVHSIDNGNLYSLILSTLQKGQI